MNLLNKKPHNGDIRVIYTDLPLFCSVQVYQDGAWRVDV